MSSRKREIYARAAVQLRSHERPAVAETACHGAMGMYFFLLLQARGEGSDGDVHEVIALAHWSVSTPYRRRQTEALILAGLVERRDGRLWIIRYEDHNDNIAVIDSNRKASAERQRSHRKSQVGHADVTRDEVPVSRVTAPSVTYSISSSISDLSRVRDPDPTSTPREPAQFETGSSASHRASEVFSDAVGAATGGTFVLDRAPFTAKDICTAMGHAPKGATLTQALDWLTPTVGEWVASGEARPLTPRRFNDWLNERAAPKRPVSFVRTKNADRQPHDEGWLKRMREREAAAGTGTDDIFGGDL